MSEDGSSEKPLAVQLAEAGVEDASAIAAAVQAEQGDKSGTVGRFLSNTSPQEIADAAGSLFASMSGPAEPRQNQRPPTQAVSEPEPARAATDGGGDEIGGSPMRQEALNEMEESDDGDETEETDGEE